MDTLLQFFLLLPVLVALFYFSMFLYYRLRKFFETIYVGWALFSILCGLMGFILMQQTPDPDAMFLSILDSLAIVQIFNVKLHFILLAFCPISMIISISRPRFESSAK